jgi:hypothetical protein
LLAGLVLTIMDITGSNISANQNDYVIGKITWVNLASYNRPELQRQLHLLAKLHLAEQCV